MPFFDKSIRRFPALRPSLLLWGALFLLPFFPLSAGEESAVVRSTIAKAVLAASPAEKTGLIKSLAAHPDPDIKKFLVFWREDKLYVLPPMGAEPASVVFYLSETKDSQGKYAPLNLLTGQPVAGPDGKPLSLDPYDLTSVPHDSELRSVMKQVLDQMALVDENPSVRIKAANAIGLSQDAAKLPTLRARIPAEQDPNVLVAMREAVALIQINDSDISVKKEGLEELTRLHTLSSYDILARLLKTEKARSPVDEALISDINRALRAVEDHRRIVNTFGTLFRGLSLGSVLLVVALGLAITFGLMGVINMAHGEVMVVGAYTTYMVQNIFGSGIALSPFGMSVNIPGFNATGWAYQSYFLFALPASFLMAALVGIALERGIIQFLYRRPLESLLATWGVSLVMQQLFRLIFGSNNVQVSSPSWLSGNWTVYDIIFGWNRVFVICFAVAIVVATWMVLNRTPLGLMIRSVMQNRAMAACVGVKTERVNMLTFGFGSGLAGLAGAFLSQIGNVGPSLGQNYIVDCFMTVVVGGASSIAGTVVSALGIGMADQSLQQILLNPVLGKILVLVFIILFLQWKPAGLFVTKSRNLEG